MITTKEHKILNLPFNATTKEIKSKFRYLSKMYHPDKKSGNKTEFIKISDAYSKLMELPSNTIQESPIIKYIKNINLLNKDYISINLESRRIISKLTNTEVNNLDLIRSVGKYCCSSILCKKCNGINMILNNQLYYYKIIKTQYNLKLTKKTRDGSKWILKKKGPHIIGKIPADIHCVLLINNNDDDFFELELNKRPTCAQQ